MSDSPPLPPVAPRTPHLVSVVAPIYNEEGAVEEFYSRVCGALEGLPFELVLVDDGSTDGSPMLLQRLAASDAAGADRPAVAKLRASDRADGRA